MRAFEHPERQWKWAIHDWLRDRGMTRRGRAGARPLAYAIRVGLGTSDETGDDDSLLDTAAVDYRNTDTRFAEVLDEVIRSERYWRRALIVLKYRYGFDAKEIAYCFGFTESWVSLWLKRIQSRISARIEKEARSPGKGAGGVGAVLPEETGRIRWGLESFEDRGLEKIQSW